MKKLLLTILLPTVLMLTACHSNSISKISSGVKVIGKCCKDLSLTGKTSCSYSDEEEKNSATEYTKNSSLLPTNSWDAKMMLW